MILYEKQFDVKFKWSGRIVAVHIKYEVQFFPLRFTVRVPDKVFCSRNPYSALLWAIQSQTVAAVKYSELKDDVRASGGWRALPLRGGGDE